MRFPLRKIARTESRWLILSVLMAASLWLGAKSGAYDRLYGRSIAPLGIVSLELAGETHTAYRIVEFWNRSGAGYVALVGLRYDLVFLLFYSTTMALACVMAADVFRATGTHTVDQQNAGTQAEQKPWHWLKIYELGILLAWGQWLASLLDAAEDVGLYNMLSKRFTSPWTGYDWAAVTWWCAALKFALVSLGGLYILAAIAFYAWSAFVNSGVMRALRKTSATEDT
jgi:hypothetical protein